MYYDTFGYVIAILLIIFAIAVALVGFKHRKIGAVIAPTLLIVLIVSVGLPILGLSEENNPDQPLSVLRYDDYVELDDLDSATGALEVITLFDKSYLHAKDVGEGTYTQKGATNTVEVSKAELLVYMIAGQSNSSHEVYSRTMVEPVIAPGLAYYFGTDSAVMTWSSNYNVLNKSMYDMVQGGNPIAANIDMPFAYTLNELTGKKIYVVNVGIGGTNVNSWTPENTSWTYAKAVFDKAVQSINTEYYDYTINDVIWIQGEADSGTSVSTYKSKFLEFYDSLTNPDSSNAFGHTFNNILISKVRSYNGVNSSKAQIQLCTNNPHILMASKLSDSFTMDNGLMLGDNVHYSQLGDNLLGIAIAKFAYEV